MSMGASALAGIDTSLYRGTFIRDAALGRGSWFGCGGSADILFEPADADDLALFLKNYPADAPLTVLGGMANTIIRDGGIRGVTVMLGKAFATVDLDGTHVRAGARALNGTVASAAAKVGIGGLEFLSGIPGTVGGAVRMNAGAYGTEVKDVFVRVSAIGRKGSFFSFAPEDMGFSYRNCIIPEDYIFISAELEGRDETRDDVRARLKDIKVKRQESQPITEQTGGSTFANPSVATLKAAGLPEDLRAWQLVERVGGRDLEVGGARMSDKHLNFMINTGNATAGDLEDLGDELIKRVYNDCGVTLHWEIKRIGDRYAF